MFALAANQIFILPGNLQSAGTVLAKNALCFALHAVPQPSPNLSQGQEVPLPNIVVASKKKLHLFRPVS